MMEYMAKQFTSIFPFGIIAKGEILSRQYTEALGEATLDDMVRRGVLERIGRDDTEDSAKPGAEEAAEKGGEEQTEAPGEGGKAQAEAPGESDAEPEAEELEAEDGEGLEPDTMDDVVEEAGEPESAPTVKPKKSGGGRKGK